MLVDLHDPRAAEPTLCGAKAANLARAATAGLPTLGGFVLTTAATASWPDSRVEALAAWRALGAPRVVVRSSSTVEDIGSSSMAGQFTSVLGVTDEEAFLHAVEVVLASGRSPHSGDGGLPMAVLVQPEVEAVCGGVLFGLDPVTGDRHATVVDAVLGSPEQVVSGSTVAAHVVLGPRGRVRSWQGPRLDGLLPPSRRRALVSLARRAEKAFGGPQDVEWAVDAAGALWLLQSRPVTATGVAPRGPRYGPGPLAETFPDPLAPLEVALWIDPLRDAITAALAVLGAVPERRIRASEVVVVLGGRPAVDLELIGAAPAGHRWWRRLDPVAGTLRVLAAWRTGRLRSALPLLAGDLVAAVDRELLEVPPLPALDDAALLDLLEAARNDLRALHGYEILCGMLLPAGATTAAGAALGALAAARHRGAAEVAIAPEQPAVLALVPPRIGGRPALPPGHGVIGGHVRLSELPPREALRLRCRWVQELSARAVEEVATRLLDAGVVTDREVVRTWPLEGLGAALTAGIVPAAEPFEPEPPLPMAFRLAARTPVATGDAGPGGVGAGSGRATGRVRHPGTAPTPGQDEVLVVDVLAPQLAAELGRVRAIVSETGSPLSHLAILAREQHVPVAVGVEGARRRVPEGALVLVDGTAGTVTLLDEDGAA